MLCPCLGPYSGYLINYNISITRDVFMRLPEDSPIHGPKHVAVINKANVNNII
jgi:hypothetical protein